MILVMEQSASTSMGEGVAFMVLLWCALWCEDVALLCFFLLTRDRGLVGKNAS